MTKSLIYKKENGDIVQAFQNQCTIRQFATIENMTKFMLATNDGDKSDAVAFYSYVKSMTNQYTPIQTVAQLKKISN